MDEYGAYGLSVEKIKSILDSQIQCEQFVVAYSAGMDSHVLLDLVVKAVQPHNIKVSALHIHHGLNPKADDWANHCEKICAELKVPLTVLWVDAQNYDGRSPEEVAREARFSAFEQYLKPGDCLLLAHHADDQAETILLRLFRGSGPTGLSGMTAHVQLAGNDLLRPLLQFSKKEIQDYAVQHKLSWMDDDSNQNCRFDRNFLRQEILPKLTTRWPRVVKSVTRAGALCLETVTAVQILAKEDFLKSLGKTQNSLSVPALLKLEPARRRGVIRHWLASLNCLPLSLDHMLRLDEEVLQAKSGAKPRLKIGNHEIQRVKKELILITLAIPGKKKVKVSAVP